MHYAPHLFCINSDFRASPNTCANGMRSHTKNRHTSFADEASACPLFLNAQASECNCEQDINAQVTRKMCDYFSSKRARNSTHAENHFCDCLVHRPIMRIKQPVVQVCDTNCCACEANVRMAAMLAEFVLCNHLQRSGKDKKNMLYHHQNSNCNGCHFMLHALKMTVFPLDGIMIRLKSTYVLKETSLR